MQKWNKPLSSGSRANRWLLLPGWLRLLGLGSQTAAVAQTIDPPLPMEAESPLGAHSSMMWTGVYESLCATGNPGVVPNALVSGVLMGEVLLFLGAIALWYSHTHRSSRRLQQLQTELQQTHAALQRERCDRQQVETTALQESESRFRQLAETIQQVFWLFDPITQQTLYVSPAYEQIWGQPLNSVYASGWSWADAIHPDDRHRVLTLFTNSLSGEHDVEYQIVRPDGAVRWVRDRAFPIVNELGQVYRVAGIAEDITERKRVETALQDRKERLRLALEAAHMSLWELNLLTREEVWSPQAEALFGFAPGTFDGRQESFLSRVHPDDRETIHQSSQVAMQTGNLRTEYRIVLPDQTMRWIYCLGKVFYDEASHPIRIVGVDLDITERKQIEADRRESEQRFRKMAANVPGAIFRYVLHDDGSDQVMYMSPGCFDLWEVEAEAVVENAQILWSMVHPDDREAMYASVMTSARTLQPWVWQWRIMTPSGQMKWLEASGRPERGTKGDIVWDTLITDVSDRKFIEQQLSASLKALDSHFDNSLLAIIEWDSDRHITRWSKQAEQTFGWTEAEIQAMVMADWQFVYEEDFDRVVSQVAVLRSGLISSCRTQNRNYCKDGTVITCEWNSSATFDDAGNLVSMLSFAQDITDRKSAEDALQESETRFRQLAENIQEVFWMADVEFSQILYVSPAYETIWGRTCASLCDHPASFVEAIHPEDRDRALTLIQHQRYQGWEQEYRIIQPDGSQRWIWEQAFPVANATGQVERLVGICQDISEAKRSEVVRKATEIALAESQKQYQNLVENSPDLIERFDLDLRHLYVSPALTRLTGVSGVEFLGKTCRELSLDENMVNAWASAVTQLLATGQKQVIEFETPTLNGIRAFEMAIVPELSDQQTIESILCISRDISDRKQFEATLQQRLQREQALNRVFQAIRQSLDLDRVFATATAETSQLLQGLDCFVVQYFPALGFWKHIAEFRPHPNSPCLIALEIPDADNPFANQLKHRQIVRLESTDRLEDPINRDLAHHLPGAWLLIPLVVEGTVWGSFTLNTAQKPFTWTDEQVELAQMVAGQLEVAIQQAQLYQQVEQEKQKLLSSQTALTEAQQIAHLGNWEFDIQTQKITWSQELFRMFGCDPSQSAPSYTDYLQHHIHPDDRAGLSLCVEQAISQGTSYTVDYRAVLPDGSMRYHEGRGQVEYDAQGQTIRLLGTALDISDRKQAEQQLQNLVEGTAATTGQDFFPALVSHMAKALNVTYALVTEEVEGTLQSLAFWAGGVLQPTFTYHPARTPCEWALRDGKFYCECLVQQLFPQDLDLVEMGAESYLGIALQDTQGRAIGNLCILHTQRIPNPQQAENLMRVFAARAVAELERSRATQSLEHVNRNLEVLVEQRTADLMQRSAQLEAINKELESFSYSVSHDLRAPLRHVNGFVNALQQRLQSHGALADPKVIHYLQVIKNSSQKMAQLIDGLLSLSRLSRKPIAYDPLLLRDLVDRAIALAQNQTAPTTPVEFVIGELPTVQGDTTLLQQVLSNLIGNAVKFSRHHPSPQIEIGTLPDGTLFVRDNGVGFQMEYADKLFGAFQRLHTLTEFEGTGIGLAIVQRIIHRHGGTIWAESQPNQGATFYFTLGDA